MAVFPKLTAPASLTTGEPKSTAQFDAPHYGSVGNLTRIGVIWRAVLTASRYAIRIASAAVLARLVSPHDYGLVAMVATLMAFLEVASDLGLSWATVQRRTILRVQIDNLFWANTVAGISLFGVCWLVAPAVAAFYGRPELGRLTVAMGSGFLFGGLAVQPNALLTRQMRLKAASIVEIFSFAVSTGIAILMAVHGYGYWALVGQAVSGQAIRAALMFWASGYWPGLPTRNKETLELLKFGGYLAGFGFVNYFARNLDNVLVGKMWGAEQLGYYSRAYYLMTLPTLLFTSSFGSVMIAALSASFRDRIRMSAAYISAVKAIALVAFPIATCLWAAAPEAVRAVYGPKWAPVVPLLAWLSIAAISQPIYGTASWLFISSGQGRPMFLWAVGSTPVLAAGFFIAARISVVAVAISYALLITVLTLPIMYFAHRAAGLELRKTARALLPIFCWAVLCGGLSYFFGAILYALQFHWFAVLAGKVALFAGLYAILSFRSIAPLYTQLMYRTVPA